MLDDDFFDDSEEDYDECEVSASVEEPLSDSHNLFFETIGEPLCSINLVDFI